MTAWFTSPLNHWIAGLLLGLALLFAVLSLRRFVLAYRTHGLTSAQWFLRAIRCLLLALTGTAWAAGFFWKQAWLLIIGLVILGQELYEGAVLGAALRTGRDIDRGKAPFG